jgi:hypothetical protein
MTDIQSFFEELMRDLRDDERHVGNAFLGDPKTADKTAWRVRAIEHGPRGWIMPGNASFNRYVSVAAFKANERGEWMRQRSVFSSTAGLMVDDVGKEIGGSVKVPFAALGAIVPTYIIETSPGNFQFWYMFKERLRDPGAFEWLINNFIKSVCGGVDPGMSGVTRVGRTPDSTNGKPANNGWQVRIAQEKKWARYSPEDLATLWKLGPLYSPYEHVPIKPPEDCSGRTANFELVLEMLQLWGHNKKGKTGLFKGALDADDFNVKGWMEIVCPWIDSHTDGADSGAAIQMPMEGNMMLGGFKCHHGHCFNEKTYKDVLRYVLASLDDETVEKTARTLAQINEGWQNGKFGSFSIRNNARGSGGDAGGGTGGDKF